MKTVCIITILLLSSFLLKAQQTSFCDGFEDGFKKGKKYMRDKTSITPICPVVKSSQDTYEYGYSVGYGKAIGKEALIVTTSNEGKFEDGFKKGYELIMTQHQKTTYIAPIKPIAPLNGDDYETGYLQGVAKAYEKLKIHKPNNTVIISEANNEDKTFCDGWEDGYNLGLKEWATHNHKSVPLKITPICPIAKINKDSYQHGFDLGMEKAQVDCSKR